MDSTNNKVQVRPEDIDLQRLKKYLQKGDHKTIAEKTGYDPSYVSLCLNPNNDRFNRAMVIAAIELIKDRISVELDPGTAEYLTNKGVNGVPNVSKSDEN